MNPKNPASTSASNPDPSKPDLPALAGLRRRFLKAATGAAAGGAALGFPMIAKAQVGPISMRWQST